MIFHPMQKKINVNVPLVMENTAIKKVIETKFLAVIVDQHLSWNPILALFLKNIKNCGITAKARFYLSSKTLPTLLLFPGISLPKML